MIRYSLLTLAIVFVLAYAWRDWFKSLCAIIAFMGVYLRKDMPTSMLGVQGLNLFNIMLLNVLLAWAASRRRERLRWDLPAHVSLLLALYLLIFLVSFARMMADPGGLQTSSGDLWSNYFVNTLKWVIPALLLYDGCRSRERFYWGLFAILAIYLLLALQCARLIMPSVDLAELERRSRKILELQTGYHRIDLSTMLSGASWALFAAHVLFRRVWLRMAVLGASLAIFYGQLLTAGRAGYLTWAGVGLVLCSLRWRRYLLVAPILVLGVSLALPAVVERALEGFVSDEASMVGEDSIDETKLFAGRNRIWPYVIAKIRENPLIGYGRQAQRRLGLARFASLELHDAFGHPHNAYLELLLDTGIVGFVPVMAFFGVALFHGLRLFLDSRSPVFIAAGAAAMALTLGWMGGSMGAQTFYPREGSVGMWCAILLMFRVSVERSRAIARLRQAARQARLGLVAPAPEVLPRPRPVLAQGVPGRRTASRRRRSEGVPGGQPTTLDGQLWARSA